MHLKTLDSKHLLIRNNVGKYLNIVPTSFKHIGTMFFCVYMIFVNEIGTHMFR